MKIIEKVSFNIASEASYVYILSRQKFTKNTQKWSIWRLFEKLKLAVKLLRDRSLLKVQKLMENAKVEKLKCDIFGDFQTL